MTWKQKGPSTYLNGHADVFTFRERVIQTLHKQRCERRTSWDLAIMTCIAAVKKLPGSGYDSNPILSIITNETY